eukprot:16163862-Heterocapsa_arctica.AAC.1
MCGTLLKNEPPQGQVIHSPVTDAYCRLLAVTAGSGRPPNKGVQTEQPFPATNQIFVIHVASCAV